MHLYLGSHTVIITVFPYVGPLGPTYGFTSGVILGVATNVVIQLHIKEPKLNFSHVGDVKFCASAR